MGDPTNVRIMEPTSAKILPPKCPDFAPTYENFAPNLSGHRHIPMGGLSGVLVTLVLWLITCRLGKHSAFKSLSIPFHSVSRLSVYFGDVPKALVLKQLEVGEIL